MSRWHADWCTSPIIQVGDDQIPRCEKCQTSAHVRLRTANQPNPVLSVPKDEESGNLNLSWPPTVTFTSGENVTHPPADKSKGDQDAQPARCHFSDSAVVGHGAVTALSSDEFRVAILHAVGDKGKSYPIHVDLEPYKDTHFPDYDAVSYTWGDENGNSERCHPIYVGDHWDIIFQTKNCCDVLRYLRPSRGLKLVWIDAICIDQNNAEERATQVAKMGQIYSRCSQVWAWMGDDLVSNDLQGLPERRWLHELETTSGCAGAFSHSRPIQHIRKLLQRRYFRRVWVIQELVLAPRVLIPIGTVIFVADHTTARKLTKSKNDSGNKSKVSWKKTEAPWFEHIAQGRIDGLGLWDMMALTSKSHASDFRDKLYGILGLLSFGSNINLLQPNYDISAREMVIGFIAHCLVNEKRAHLFLAAQGHTAQSGPSWLPAWETQRSWEQLFAKPSVDTKLELDQGRTKMGFKYIGDVAGVPATRTAKEYIRIQFLGAPMAALVPLERRLEYFETGRDSSLEIYPWYRDFTVDSSTASISLWLRRLVSIGSAPVQVVEESFHDMNLYRIQHGPSRHFLIASQHPLDKLVKPNDELFALDPETSSSRGKLVFLVLRKKSDGRHRLVTGFAYLHFYTTASGQSRSIRERHLSDVRQDLAKTKAFFQNMLELAIYDIHDTLRGKVCYTLWMLFPGNQSTRVCDILSILTGHENFERLQANEACTRRGQKISGGYLEFGCETDFATWRSNPRDRSDVWGPFPSDLNWEWRRRGEGNNSPWRRLPQLQSNETYEDLGLPGGLMRIHLRCPVEDVRHFFDYLDQYLGITMLLKSKIFGDTIETLEKNLRSRVTEEDFLVTSPHIKRSGGLLTTGEFAGLDGGIYRVCIV